MKRADMNMKTLFGIRLWVLIGALLLVAGGTICGLFSAWHRVQDVEAKLTTSQIERFQLASEVRRELQGLNNSMLRYVLARNPQQWALFEQASSDLNHWIDGNDPSMNPKSPLATDAERQLFQELNPDWVGFDGIGPDRKQTDLRRRLGRGGDGYREQPDGSNPGTDYIRIAMVQHKDATAEALHRLVAVLG